MKYTSVIVDDREHCLEVMSRMEEEFKKGDERFFIKVMQDEPSLVLRVHAVTILADLGSQAAIPTLSKVLLNDPDPLVRHEAAFTMGQIGLASAVGPLEEAVLKDKDPIVRHESAAALGSIGSQLAKGTLEKAMSDPDELVRNSAAASLFNLEFLKTYEVGGTARDRAPRP
ncbi:MAG: HEAT repeat domain-containing protein [Nitrososphaerota archaeon]|nr:HEAT repeat domain-containing protein [Nitrososphaerota archaeon]MDG6966753.1 HEAT repeat domain-containing protein [Nitrososphaerota archaeon]MDG6979186.1 HEAT repeat domain-containing protein [Nitrososphaerota archaeon]MDG7005670.1 HEAT repeat domain-containing protein [Nitrososphaerota archaeon]MDG7021550.1 HEAT repeat domain-containing protein [Nitrososphaerota archaeon]